MIEYVMPRKLKIEEERVEEDYYYARYTLSPMEKGYGITIGNAPDYPQSETSSTSCRGARNRKDQVYS